MSECASANLCTCLCVLEYDVCAWVLVYVCVCACTCALDYIEYVLKHIHLKETRERAFRKIEGERYLRKSKRGKGI